MKPVWAAGLVVTAVVLVAFWLPAPVIDASVGAWLGARDRARGTPNLTTG